MAPDLRLRGRGLIPVSRGPEPAVAQGLATAGPRSVAASRREPASATLPAGRVRRRGTPREHWLAAASPREPAALRRARRSQVGPEPIVRTCWAPIPPG